MDIDLVSGIFLMGIFIFPPLYLKFKYNVNSVRMLAQAQVKRDIKSADTNTSQSTIKNTIKNTIKENPLRKVLNIRKRKRVMNLRICSYYLCEALYNKDKSGDYCPKHTCAFPDCNKPQFWESILCCKHQPHAFTSDSLS